MNLRAELEIVLAVAGRGVDEARAGVGRDVLAGKQRHGEFVAAAVERMPRRHFLGIDAGDALELHLCVLRHLLRERIGEQELLAGLRAAALLSRRHFVERRRGAWANRRSRGCRGSSTASSSR